MILFGNKERMDLDTPRAGESPFAYLDRSARPTAANVRDFLQQCLNHYPEARQADIVARLRSDDINFGAATFELLTHELLTRHGSELLSVEPTFEAVTTSPDFLFRAPSGEEFIVECVVARGMSDAEAGQHRRLEQALEAIAAIPSPTHLLSITVEALPSDQVRLRALRGAVTTWLDRLAEAPADTPNLRIELSGMQLVVSPAVERRRPFVEGGRSTASVFYGVRGARPGEDLSGAIMRKAKRYGDLGRPYLIAVNGLMHSSEDNLFDALLGSPVATIRTFGDGTMEAAEGRAPNGVWFNDHRARKTGVSAILNFDRLDIWRPWGRGRRLVHHPFADLPLPDLALPIDVFRTEDGKFEAVRQDEREALFALPAGWPGDD